jgi:leucyl/phenylalanyl-tRNA--protein transferase
VSPSPEAVIHAFMSGRFPLTSSDSGEIFWSSKEHRGIMPIDEFHIPKNLKRTLRQDRFQVSIDCCFEDVARNFSGRTETWISPQIVELYSKLHRQGFAHSFEVWQDGTELIGGYFGLVIGGYFVGISQFKEVRDAGKIAFLHCMHVLRTHSFAMHDVQAFTPHLEQFGCFKMGKEDFRKQLLAAVASSAKFDWFAHQIPRPTSEAVLKLKQGETTSKRTTATADA